MISVVLVDDHAVVREGYRALLSRQPGVSVVGEYGDAHSASIAMRDEAPDVVIMDLNMPGASALTVLERLHCRHPRMRSLVFTMYVNRALARKAFAAGATGYVTKSSEPEVLLTGLRKVASGERYVSADLAQSLALEDLDGRQASIDALSPTEVEVLRLMLTGRAAAEIAAALHLSVKTVRNNHYNLKRKLGVRNDIDLARYCAEAGLGV